MFYVLQGKVQSMEDIVSEHEQYQEAVRDFNDWLTSAKEELQRWSDLSGDAVSVQRKLSKVRVRRTKYTIQTLCCVSRMIASFTRQDGKLCIPYDLELY